MRGCAAFATKVARGGGRAHADPEPMPGGRIRSSHRWIARRTRAARRR